MRVLVLVLVLVLVRVLVCGSQGRRELADW